MRLGLIGLVVVHLTTLVTAQSPAALGAPGGVNVANVPDCAKACLSNSTQYASDCPQIDVKCLCNSPAYVSALSCCLATNCNPADQQTALQFNIQECAAVNSTAPNFVGCSPFSLTTGQSNLKTTASSASANTLQTTISGEYANIPAAFTNTKLETATFEGSAILTGSCTVPFFAQITATGGSQTQFPQVGCALNRGNCCPFDPSQYYGLTKCPADYTTTAAGCCPSGYSVYYTALGAETPCFSRPFLTYQPATTPTGSQLTLITDTVFSKRYILVQPPKKALSTGAIVVIAIIAVLLICLPFVIYYLIRRHKARKTAKEPLPSSETFPPVEPQLQQMSEVPVDPRSPVINELANAEGTTPATLRSMPYTFEKPADSIAHEMPGSMYIHEHHPAFTDSQSDVRTMTESTPPRTPPRSPAQTSTRSPVLSPSSPFRPESLNSAAPVVTPLGSPRPAPLTSSPSTRFREGTM